MRDKPVQCSGRQLYSFLFFSILLHTKISLSQPCNYDDFKSLQMFYFGVQSKAVLGWSWNDSSSNCCEWMGVFCGSLGSRVIGLDLSNKSLNGFLPDSFAGLNHLKSLNLSSNSFLGSAPSSIFQLPKLNLLDLSLNSLSGIIPPIINLPSIRIFNLSFNLFSGRHPILPNSSNLQQFDISSNSFLGRIDSSLCNHSSSLQILRFSMNKFYGNFPPGYGYCTSLTELSLDMNILTGTLPDDLFKLTDMKKLYFQRNSLTGTLSPKIGNLSNLVNLGLSGNNFFGIIPDVFDKFKKLETFYASSNALIGFLPPSLSTCSTLKVLSLRNNSLSGEINLNFSSLVKLNTLNLGSNHFTGRIPSSLPLCAEMETLNLGKNNLLGEIPSSFKNLTSLTYLYLAHMKFSNITLTLQILQYLPNLSTLVLTKSFQSGQTMPFEGINGFLSIEVFVMANCALNGLIPLWLLNLKKLHVLDISWNQLSGTIPPCFGNFDHLFYLDVSYNYITGEIPLSLAQTNSLMVSDTLTTQKHLAEELPFYVKTNSTAQPLQYNQISSFPPSLVLSHNSLGGPILPEFGNLIELLILDLSYNSLTGTIPDQIASMSSLETLDLSHNDLTGTIPQRFSDLSMLNHLDLSYNNLSGKIPSEGQLDTFIDISVYVGNAYLCGPPTNKTCGESDGGTIVDFRVHNKLGFEMPWLYYSSGLGFIFGCWCVWVVLIFCRVWRIAYFQMIDRLFDNIYVHLVLTMRKLKQVIGR